MRRRLTFPPDCVAAVYRGCGAGCRANENTTDKAASVPSSASRGLASNKWSLRFTLGRLYTPSAAYYRVPQRSLARSQWRKTPWEKSLFKLDATLRRPLRPCFLRRKTLVGGSEKRFEMRDKRISCLGLRCSRSTGNKVVINNCENSCVVI